MAESMLVAFGRFLRLLRERRGLSLDQVEALTSAYPEPVSKAYLSRTENGHSRIAFSRMIAICRAYEYPIDAASERLWLDLGVDRMEDPPDTAGKGAKELLREGRSYIQRGFRWHAYACARDAIAVARTTPVSESFRDHEEQFGICLMNTATAATTLGRYRFARSEFHHLEHLTTFQPRYSTVILVQSATALRGLGRLDESANYADRAIAAASATGAEEYLGESLTSRALISYSAGDHRSALDHFRSALRHHREHGKEAEAGIALANLAQTSFEVGRVGAARRFLAAANRVAERLELNGLRARVLILTGEIHQDAGDLDSAERCWKEAQRLATGLGDSVLIFKVKYFLFRLSLRLGKAATARRLEKSLHRLAPWIPIDTDELRAFKQDCATTKLAANSVAFPARNTANETPETRGSSKS